MQNEVLVRAYETAVQRGQLATVKGYALTADDRLRADIIERIMCDFAVDLGAVCARHGASAEAVLRSSPRLWELLTKDIVKLEGPSLTIADEARFLVRSVAAAFDAHLDSAQKLHSRAV